VGKIILNRDLFIQYIRSAAERDIDEVPSLSVDFYNTYVEKIHKASVKSVLAEVEFHFEFSSALV